MTHAADPHMPHTAAAPEDRAPSEDVPPHKDVLFQQNGTAHKGGPPPTDDQRRPAYGTDAFLRDLLVMADTAPSVHNTRPTRWRWAPGGALWVGTDTTRHLPGSDPHQNDLGISAGAAVMTTLIALADMGHPGTVERLWDQDDRRTWPGHRMVARIVPLERHDARLHAGTIHQGTLGEGPRDDEPPQDDDPRRGDNHRRDGDLQRLAPSLTARRTWRRGFRHPIPMEQATVDAWAGCLTDATWITGSEAKVLVRMGDAAALAQLRVPAVRHELAAWMRPASNAPDGLTAQALGMSPWMCRAARFVLGTPAFTLLDSVGMMGPFVAEQDASARMAGLLIVHTDAASCAAAGGMLLARLWLEATALGLAGWPMAALLDHGPTQNTLRARTGIAPERRLVMALRLGFPY